MGNKKYRIKEYDIVNNIYILQKHVFWFIWRGIGAGSKEKLEKKIKELT